MNAPVQRRAACGVSAATDDSASSPTLFGDSLAVSIDEPSPYFLRERPYVIVSWFEESGGIRILAHLLENADQPRRPMPRSAERLQPRLELTSRYDKDPILAELTYQIQSSFPFRLLKDRYTAIALHIFPGVVHRLLKSASHSGNRSMGDGWNIGSIKQIGPRSTTIFERIHVNNTCSWNAELTQWSDEGMHSLLVLSIDEQTVWDSPLRLEPHEAFIDLLIERSISVRFGYHDEFIEKPTENTSRSKQRVSHQLQ